MGIIDIFTAADQKWHEEEAARQHQQKFNNYCNTYYDVCCVMTPLLRENAAMWEITSPTDPSMVVADPPIYEDRGAIFYTLRIKRNKDSQINGSHLKYLMNTQIPSYCVFHQCDLLQYDLYLLSRLRIVAVGERGIIQYLYIGRLDDPATVKYIQNQQHRKRHPSDRNMI